MALRPILTYPHPTLKAVAEPVHDFGPELGTLLDDMVETMHAAPGIGLAAPQIGLRSRVLVMHCTRERDSETAGETAQEEAEIFRMVNPEILWHSPEQRLYEEGCLSLPEQYAEVQRPKEVKVRYQDETGAVQERHLRGLEATCVQHELDHLDGVLFWDHVGPTRRSLLQRKLKKLLKERAAEAKREAS